MGKHDKRKEPIDLRDVAVQSVSALVVGTILLLIDKYII